MDIDTRDLVSLCCGREVIMCSEETAWSPDYGPLIERWLQCPCGAVLGDGEAVHPATYQGMLDESEADE